MTRRPSSGPLPSLIFLALVLGAPRLAAANSADTFGMGSRAMGRAGAMTAAADDYEALFYNPAGLAAVERPTLTLGYMRVMSGLRWSTTGNSDPAIPSSGNGNISEPDSLMFALTLPLGRLSLGAFVGTLPTKFVTVDIREPSVPTFGYYTNRTQRMLVLIGGAFDFGHGVSLGVAVDVFADLDGPVYANVGPTGDVQPSIFLGAGTLARAVLGLRWAVDDDLRFGITYRQEFQLPVHVAAQSTVGDVPLTIDFTTNALQTPHELAFGGAYRIGIADLSADFTYQRWSTLPAPWIDVDALVTGIGISSPATPRAFRDAYDVRVGTEVTHALHDDYGLRYRAGLRYETSMGVLQTMSTNMLDGHKLGGAVGLGFHHGDVWGLPLDVDAHFDLTEMFDRTSTKASSADSPYDSITGGGLVYSFGLTVSLGLTR